MEKLGLVPDPGLSESCLLYLTLLSAWNKAYNLTAVHGMENMMNHHVLDSLSVLPYLKGNICLDVGSGAGLPGMVLALARPQHHWVLLDSNRKKIRFLNQAVMDLEINNVQVVHSRIEEYLPESGFSTIISRALTSVREFYEQVVPLAEGKGRIILMKGKNIDDEIREFDLENVKPEVHTVNVPGLDRTRHLVILDIDQN